MRKDKSKKQVKGHKQWRTREDRQSGNPGFVYPYNFVPVGEIQKRNSFKPLHRYDGLTGRIHYKLKTLSPIFIPDPEGTTIYQLDKINTDKIHKVMNFFNVDGKLCIPSTSIKGMVRSVVEAATNSTFGVFDCIDKKYAYRKDKDFRRKIGIYMDKQIIPAKIAKLPRKALEDAIKYILGKSNIDFNDIAKFQNENIQIKLWKIHTGMPLVVEFNMRGESFKTITIPRLNQGNGYIKQRPGNPKKRMIAVGNTFYYCPWDNDIWNALNVPKDWPDRLILVNFKYADFPEIEAFDPDRGIGTNRVVEITVIDQHGINHRWSGIGTCFINGRLLLQKFFLDDVVRNSRIKKSDRYVYVVYDYSDSPLKIAEDVLKDYIDVNNQEPFDNQVIFYETDHNGEILEFGPVAVFKSAENSSLCELIEGTNPSILYPQSSSELCPATRLFGWVPENELSNEQGIAGRVRFTTAWSDKTIDNTILVPLKILGSPNPKYYPFYLKAKDGSKGAGYYTLGPDNPWAQKEGVIRGRKFYLHHPEAINNSTEETSYIHLENQKFSNEFKKDLTTWPHTNQNSTCRILPSGAEFSGTIEFESLDSYELGMLLWCLTLSDNPLESSKEHAHKIGMGKGIGMGSVRFEIEGVYLEEPEKNWFELDSDSIDPEYIDRKGLESNELKNHVMAFKRWLLDCDNSVADSTVNAKFNGLTFIADLLRILKLNLVDINTPIQYYREYADKGYEYFMDQRKKRNRNEEETLKTPSEIESGGRQNG